MALDQRKYEHKHTAILRDVRPLWTRIADALTTPSYSTAVFIMAGGAILWNDWALAFADLIILFLLLYFLWLRSRDKSLAFKMPLGAKFMDPNNGRGNKPGKPEGILYLGNVENTNEEVWFTNSDARTHVLYLGTTGAGKTEGLKSMVSNALAWGSGFVYVDGKADTDLWSSLSSLVRRFGRDDDLLVLNYMTGNADVQAPSNTMNPFSSGSASYLVNMLVSLMPESEGDNAMWKERAVALVSAMMPILTWKRDHQDMPLSVRTIRDYLSLNNVIKLQRDNAVPKELREGIDGYLDTLPGFVGDAYDDEGKVKPPGPDTPQYDTNTASQQHGYLAMQFTRSLQSLGDDYGYIFDTQAADVDMVDVVLNRRILIVLIPALEKSGDEIANLGKIVASTMKGMMGSALGSTVEGDSASVIENKPTHSNTPFMTVFDEVGYYTAQGMAVMAAQARSLGFCLIFSGQDLPAMKKRVREEAQSITANCNIKIFGKLEDPTETKEFFEKTVGTAIVTEVSGFQMAGGTEMGSYFDTQQAGVQMRPRASYDDLRGFKEGQAVITFGDVVVDCAVFYSNPGFAKAMRVTRFLALPPPDEEIMKHAGSITKLRDLMVNKSWTAQRADVAVETPPEIAALKKGFEKPRKKDVTPVERAISAIVEVHAIDNEIETTPSQAAATTAPQTAPPPTTPTPEASTPPAAKPQATPPATQTTPPPAENAEQSGNPMGFFGANKSAENPASPPTRTTPPPATPPATKQQQPPTAAPTKTGTEDTKSWQDLIDENAQPAETPSAAQEPQPPVTPATSVLPPTAEPAQNTKSALPKEIQDIIENAGDKAREALFKNSEDRNATE
ncbi:MAG TPA: TraM recognition domain-containing protein [Alphaproteobacteria bacterium]|nr:TraM recognition domain-containing protein [Alphaproteobacteria bacterium]USO05493.1 MAG: TraM recognition domain-containing protein [Rhodospirillales bacterium]HOO81504.1 TraM recognition domain-containing protein [Alphaproteobacteria bacterium]